MSKGWCGIRRLASQPLSTNQLHPKYQESTNKCHPPRSHVAPALRQHLTAWNERSASVRPEVPTTWLTSFTQSTRSYSLTRSPSCGICEGISILRASSSSFESASIFFLPSEETEAQSYVACPWPCSELVAVLDVESRSCCP